MTATLRADYTPSPQFIKVVIGEAKHLSRVVFYDLLDKDLLGFLLSPLHFHQHLLQMQRCCDQFTTRQLQCVVSDAHRLHVFHKSTLAMFCATHIAECKHKSAEELMAALDQKCKALPGYRTSTELAMELNLNEINQVEIEMAWRYRARVNGGRSVVQVQ